MSFYIIEKNPSTEEELSKAHKPILLIFKMMETMPAAYLNQQASKMVKVSEAFYNFTVNEAKKAGVPVLTKVPTARNATETMT